MKLTRVYADADGESHVEDIEVEFSPVDFAPPALPGVARKLWEGTWNLRMKEQGRTRS